MRNQKLKLVFYIFITIVFGLLSRQVEWIPVFVGDSLYAIMMFFIVQFFLIKESKSNIAVITLAVTYTIEFSQLFKASWIVSIRATTLGRLVLGQGFLWADIISYTIGVVSILWITKLLRNRGIRSRDITKVSINDDHK